MPDPRRPRRSLARSARIVIAALLAVGAAARPAAAQQAEPAAYDLLLRGGTLIDGRADATPQPADVAIRDGRIVALGELPAGAAAARELDCTGLLVAPGFIDVHTHADRAAARRGEARNFVSMGVATIVTGNCGSSVTDLAAHFAEVGRRGIAVNYASLIGHGTVRREVLGRADRAPTDAELRQMQALVQDALDAGACGMSTGLIYVPGSFASTAELAALCEPVAAAGGVYATHMRNEGDDVLEAIAEALEIGRRAGCRVHLSHLKASGRNNWGRSAEILAALESARDAGVQVTGDQYAYTASSTSLDVLFPDRARAIGRRAFGAKLADDDDFRAAMHGALRRTMERSGFGDLSWAQIASAPQHPELAGKRIPEAARELFDASDRDAQARCAIQLMIDAEGGRVGMVYHKMAERDVEALLRAPYVAVASDSGIRMYRTASKPHPRGAGNNPRVLGRYVRERGTLPLPLAIHKMTALPARVFGLEDRGELRVGAAADVVVFAGETVAGRATYTDPLAAPEGIVHLAVSGTLVLDDGERTGARPGRVLRHTAAPRPRTPSSGDR